MKRIKNSFKEQKLLKEYKQKYKHKQMVFMFSNIMLTLNENADVEKLIEVEKELLRKEISEDMFEVYALRGKEISGMDLDWESFSKFIWYVFQTSTYYSDIKKGKHNIYNVENYIELNSTKRKLYFNFIHSIDKNLEGYNDKIMRILEITY